MSGPKRLVWHGVLDPTQYSDSVVSARHQLADAAKAGDWPLVPRMLDAPRTPLTANDWRPGGTAWFTPLHQAAWHGAPARVAQELVARGALRSLADSRGRSALDVRIARNSAELQSKGFGAESHLALRGVLAPSASPLSPTRIRALDAHLAAVIERRIKGVLYDGRDPQSVLRYPPVAIMHEAPNRRVATVGRILRGSMRSAVIVSRSFGDSVVCRWLVGQCCP